MTRSKVITILIAACVILHFCVVNDIVRFHLLVATVAYPLLALYFFPVMAILDSIKIKEKKEILYSIISGFVFSNILCFALAQQLLPDNQIVYYTLLAFKLVNSALLYVYLFVKTNKSRGFWHFLFMFFSL